MTYKMQLRNELNEVLTRAKSAAKWMDRKGDTARRLKNTWGVSPKFYRKFLVHMTEVTESKMCAKDWSNINFSFVPSKAMTIYTKAFKRNAQDAFQL